MSGYAKEGKGNEMTPASVKQKVSWSHASTKTSPSAGPAAGASIAPPNRTGLPDVLKSGVESLSGFSLNDVRVHTNSPKPAQLQALAYTQGTDIHIAPGQERHLPHEAWHVVQQKQGRVKPTRQLKSTYQINDDAGLEKEADRMGDKSVQLQSEVTQRKADQHINGCSCGTCAPTSSPQVKLPDNTIQRKIEIGSGVEKEAANAELYTRNVMDIDGSIPGTFNEIKAIIEGMIADEISRTMFADVMVGVRNEIKNIVRYSGKKNIANTTLRMAHPDRVFMDTDTSDDMDEFTHSKILGKDAPSEVGYLVHYESGRVLGAGLGKERVINPHEIGADGTKLDWAGHILTHSHPSGSPHTIPNDINAAISKGASKSIVLTRDFQFTVQIDYKNPAILKYKKQHNLMDLKLALSKADREGQTAWTEEAATQGYDGFVYNRDSEMNPQEKEILENEFSQTSAGANEKKWTMGLDYAMAKFMGYEKVKKVFEAQGLTLTGPTKDDYLKYRLKFYKGKKLEKKQDEKKKKKDKFTDMMW